MVKALFYKKYIRILFCVAFATFVLNKFYLRPWVLENDFSKAIKIFVLSLPNLIEVILGITVVTGMLYEVKKYLKDIGNVVINIIAVLLIG